METQKPWRCALLVSALIHGILLVGIGLLSVFAATAGVPKDYLEIELVSEATIPINEGPAMRPPSTLPAVITDPARAADPILATVASAVGNTSLVDSQTATGTLLATTTSGVPLSVAGNSIPGSKKPSLLAPRILHKVEPEYPEEARLQGWEGKVTVKLEVMSDGLVDNVVIVNSSGYGVLDDVAAQAVHQWRFIPAKNTANDASIRCFTIVSLVFKLDSLGR